MLSPITRNRFWQQQILHCWKWSFLWYNKYILTDYLNREDSPREIFAFSGVKNSSHAWIQRIFFQGRGNNCVCKRVAKEGFWRSNFGNLCEFNKFDFPGVLDPPFRIRAWSWYRPHSQCIYLPDWMVVSKTSFRPIELEPPLFEHVQENRVSW